ncbi:MAG: FxSxx-COOH system tetratricopeptide repeat protein [Phycisphaerae bacterium]|nr:FxSxx-COOH system tetratricopeptide repeat protein [Tepidisphaeraceae bacterium]
MDLRFRDDPADERQQAAGGTLFHVPPRRNEFFVGREDLLTDLAGEMASADLTRHAQALYGLGGVGKTQAAVEFAHRYRDKYKIVWWLRAEESAGVWIDYQQLARALGLTMPRDASLDAVRQHLKRHLEGRDDYLLVFDNASGPAGIKDFIPSPCRGGALVTSRNANWAGVARGVPVHGLARDESVTFLRKRTGRRMDADSSARKLAQTLGDLPLALEQAGALIAQSRMSFDDYLRRFETQWAEMLAAQRPGGDYPDSVAMSWELSFRQAEEEHPAAIALLNLVSFLSPDGIPRRLIEDHLTTLPEPLGDLASDPRGLDRPLGVLGQYSLLELTGGGSPDASFDLRTVAAPTISVHRLVAALARDRLGEDDRRVWSATAARLVGGAFVFDSADAATWADAGAVLPHALAAATHAQAAGAPVELTCNLLDQAGRYLNRFAQYEQAKGLLDRAMALSRRAYGDESPRVSQVANNLGRVLARLGERESARQHFEWALAIDRNTYGDADPHVASVMNNYAMVLHAGGQLDDARAHFEAALAIFEQHYGERHPKVASLLNNLGYLHLSAGDAQSAHDLFARAASVAEESLGKWHPTLAAVCCNLGRAQLKLGHPLLARDPFERALAIDMAAYGEAHPDVARDLDGMAEVARAVGNAEAATDYADRATAVRAKVAESATAVPVEG